MGPKKGLSADEKKEKLLGIYHSTKQVFNLKDIEKAGAKAGVVMQTIKELNQQLLDDGLIEGEKIGAGQFFWSFPSKALVKRLTDVTALREQIAQGQEQTAAHKRRAAELREERVDTEERQIKLRRLTSEGERRVELEAERGTLKANDPQELEVVRQQGEECKLGINRWTDNTFVIKKFIVRRFNMCGSEAEKALEMGEDFDYVS